MAAGVGTGLFAVLGQELLDVLGTEFAEFGEVFARVDDLLFAGELLQCGAVSARGDIADSGCTHCFAFRFGPTWEAFAGCCGVAWSGRDVQSGGCEVDDRVLSDGRCRPPCFIT